jgi:hypothetical protein
MLGLRERDIVFFDTTSTYLEIDVDDPADDGEENGDDADGGEASLRRLGHSKDHRPLPES